MRLSFCLFLLAAFEAAFWVSATSLSSGVATQLHEEMNGRTANYQIGGTSTLIDTASADVDFELQLPTATQKELGNDPIKPPPPTQKDQPPQNQKPVSWSRLTSSDRSTGTASAKKGGGAGNTHTATGSGGGKSGTGKSRGKGKGSKWPNQVRRAAQTTKHGSFAVNRTAADEAVGDPAVASRQQSVSVPAISSKHKKLPTQESSEQEPLNFSGGLFLLMVVCAALALLILAQYIWKRRRGSPSVQLTSIKIEDCDASAATVSPEAARELPSCVFVGDDTQKDAVPVLPQTTGQEDTSCRMTKAASLALVAADEVHTDTPPSDSASSCISVKELRKHRKAHVPCTPQMAPPPLELPPPITGEGDPPTARALLQRAKLLRQAQAAGMGNVHSTPRTIADAHGDKESPARSLGLVSADAEVTS